MGIPSLELRARVLAGDYPEWLKRHSRRIYLVNLYRSVPDWVDRKALKSVYRHCIRLNRSRAHPVVVDHIVPLTHPLVCGLTVPWNLRIIDRRENCRRSNRWWEYTEDMFTESEQVCFPLLGGGTAPIVDIEHDPRGARLGLDGALVDGAADVP